MTSKICSCFCWKVNIENKRLLCRLKLFIWMPLIKAHPSNIYNLNGWWNKRAPKTCASNSNRNCKCGILNVTRITGITPNGVLRTKSLSFLKHYSNRYTKTVHKKSTLIGKKTVWIDKLKYFYWKKPTVLISLWTLHSILSISRCLV